MSNRTVTEPLPNRVGGATMNRFERNALESLRRRGLAVLPFGKGWRVLGTGVDILTATLAGLTDSDLAPVRFSVPEFPDVAGRALSRQP